MRRVALVGATWLVGTLLAVTLAWWAVGRVSSEVVDRPAAPLSNREVAAALGADPDGTAGTTTPTGAGAPPGGTGPPATTAPSPATAPAPPTSTASTTSPPRSTVPATAPPPTSPPVPTPVAPAAATALTIDSVGGQVAVRYVAGRVELVWARPKAGFEAEVHDAGPEDVEVRFRSDDHESRVRAFYSDGAPDQEVQEEEGGGDDGDDDDD